jgi:hypothetical protein
MKGKAPVHPPQNQKTTLWWIARLSLAAALCSAIYLAIASGLNGPLAGCGGQVIAVKSCKAHGPTPSEFQLAFWQASFMAACCSGLF